MVEEIRKMITEEQYYITCVPLKFQDELYMEKIQNLNSLFILMFINQIQNLCS